MQTSPAGMLVMYVIMTSLPVIVVPVTYRPVTVETSLGTLAGYRGLYDFQLGTDNVTNEVDLYLGVPYAAPPVDHLRFEPPQPHPRWHGVRNATAPGWVCPQVDVYHPGTHDRFQNEDCLFMDIYTPVKRGMSNATFPVMVYIHGGSYEVGSGKLYNGEVLALFGVVIVTINYRLGALGFLTSGDAYLRGNYGLLDQVAALRWVHDHIGNFRGDPNHVTIFGHSAGGSSVGILLTVPSAKGLFHSAIAQSGSAMASYSYHGNKQGFPDYIRQVGIIMGCPYEDMTAVVTCLKMVPAHHFIQKRHLFPLFDPIDPEFRPIVDGVVIPQPPQEAILQGNFTSVPFMLGTVRDEFANYFNGGARHRPTFDVALDNYVNKFTGYHSVLTDVVRYEYTDWRSSLYATPEDALYDRGSLLGDMHMVAPTVLMSTLLSGQNVPTYQYYFTTGYSYHSVELNYVFGAPFSGVYADEMNTVMEMGGQNFTWVDRFYCRLVMKLWTNFAKFGHPTPFNLGPMNIRWKPYTNLTKHYLHLNQRETRMRQNFRADKVAFWNLLMPRLKNSAKQVIEPFIPPPPNYQMQMWAFLGIAGLLLLGLVILLYLLIKTRMKQIAQQAKYGVKYIDNGRAPTRV